MIAVRISNRVEVGTHVLLVDSGRRKSDVLKVLVARQMPRDAPESDFLHRMAIFERLATLFCCNWADSLSTSLRGIYMSSVLS